MEQLRATARQDHSKVLFSYPRTAHALTHALRYAAELGRPQAALSLSDAADLLTRTLGPDHLRTLASRNSLAHAYRSAGRLDEAIPLFERTLTDRERVLGPDHSDTRLFRKNLADAYRAVGRDEDAEALLDPPPAFDDAEADRPDD